MSVVFASCLFAAWVTTAPAFNNVNIIRVQTTLPCAVEAVIQEGVLILTRSSARVEIALPRDRAWHRVIYDWGRNVAILSVPVTRVVGQEGFDEH